MEASNKDILDLPDEMLLAIFNKLNMVDIFYSLLDINERFNRLIFDSFCIHNLDLTVKRSLIQRTSRLDNQTIERISKKIFPRIHQHIRKLIISPCFIECLFNIDYPQLQSLSFINFQQEKLLEHLTSNFDHFRTFEILPHIIFLDKTTVYRLLTNQIRYLKVDIVFNKNELNLFILILYLGKHLTDLTFHHRFSCEHVGNSIFDLSLSHISLTLTKLIINVITFNDCLYLLDGSLQSLTSLIIDINKISYVSSSIIDNTRKPSKLKQFSLTSSNDKYRRFNIISQCNKNRFDLY